MPVQRAVVARDDALPLFGDRRLSDSTSRTFGYRCADGHPFWESRGAATKAEDRSAISVFRTIGISILELTVATGKKR